MYPQLSYLFHFQRTEHDKAIGDINIMLDKGLNELKVLKVNMDKKFAEHKQWYVTMNRC
jgi:uncharacterized protein YdaT